MKRLITNKKFDIHDTKLVAEYNNGLNDTSTKHCIEELYLKKSGEYLLYGRGGLKTQWSANENKDEGIRPLTAKEAQDWIYLHSHDQYYYADLFGEAEE